MRKSRVWQVAAVAAVVSLLLAALTAVPALAAEEITLDPDSAEVGEEVDVTGDGFRRNDDPEDDYKVTLYFSDEGGVDINDIDSLDNFEYVDRTERTDDDGEIRTEFNVPEKLTDGDEEVNVVGGTYYVYVTYKNDDRVQAVAEFTVLAPEFTVDPDNGNVGIEVDLSGQYFEASDDLTVKFDDDTLDIEDGDTETDNDGEFDSTIQIPPAAAGDHTITVEDDSDHSAEATFTVESAATAVPDAGKVGDEVTVSGTGFAADDEVTVKFNGTIMATEDTDSDGSFTTAFNVPQVEAATYDIDVEDGEGNEASADFTMSSSVTLGTTTSDDSPGYVGMPMTISGTGFIPNGMVTVTFASTPITVATTQADSSGDFSASFNIPATTGGLHTITASDGTNSLSKTFYMEEQSPPIPLPLLPLMGDKAKALTYFDWADVTDQSGVSYTLQIASDEDFTDIVFTKAGLETSEYTLTEEERLPNTSSDAPYRWRVRAVDRAQNASGWTGAGEYYVAGLLGGFSLGDRPDWMIHLWWGLGALGAGLGGYFAGKRRSYYY